MNSKGQWLWENESPAWQIAWIKLSNCSDTRDSMDKILPIYLYRQSNRLIAPIPVTIHIALVWVVIQSSTLLAGIIDNLS